jgi:hypothetical protein
MGARETNEISAFPWRGTDGVLRGPGADSVMFMSLVSTIYKQVTGRIYTKFGNGAFGAISVQRTWHPILGLRANNEVEGIWKAAVMAQYVFISVFEYSQ